MLTAAGTDYKDSHRALELKIVLGMSVLLD
jgi:hypothetical protein